MLPRCGSRFTGIQTPRLFDSSRKRGCEEIEGELGHKLFNKKEKVVMKLSRKVQTSSWVAVILGAMVVGGAAIAETSRAGTKLSAPILAPVVKSAAMAAPMAASYAPIIKEVLPEVVAISSSRV